VSSPITLSNFNSIDFNVILNSVMQQESLPLQALQAKQSNLSSEKSAYDRLASTLQTLQTAAAGLSTRDDVVQYAATVSDTNALSVTTTTGAVPGRYEVVVNELARAQVTVSATTANDADTTQVATGGSLTIGGVQVSLSGPVTLQGLADKINGTANIPVTASVVQSDPGKYRLVLTGADTGKTHAFTITNALTGGTGVGFVDTNNDGTSGDSAADNAVQATDASLLINNIPITSASNTVTSGVPGTTLELAEKDPTKTIVVSVARDTSALTGKIQSFVSAFNDLVQFTSGQTTAANNGQSGTLGREPLLRQLKNALRSGLSAAYGSGTFTHLAEIGIGSARDGTLTIDDAALTSAIGQDLAGVTSLLGGTGGSGGAFAGLQQIIQGYTQAGGFVASAETLLTNEAARLDGQVADMQARLAIRRTALQQEYTAADLAMTTLKAQSGNLASLSGSSGSSGGLLASIG
jgi:flagellar hook-associated protein 2